MDEFTLRAVKNQLIEMKVVKIILDERSSYEESASFFIVYAYKNEIYTDYVDFDCGYKDISPGQFIEDIREEIEDIIKRHTKNFLKANKSFKEGGVYDVYDICRYIKNEVGFLRETFDMDFDYEEFENKYVDNKIPKWLEKGRSPRKIFKKLKRKFGVDFKVGDEGLNIEAEVIL